MRLHERLPTINRSDHSHFELSNLWTSLHSNPMEQFRNHFTPTGDPFMKSVATLLVLAGVRSAADKPHNLFVLARQPNMEGRARTGTFGSMAARRGPDVPLDRDLVFLGIGLARDGDRLEECGKFRLVVVFDVLFQVLDLLSIGA